MSLVFAVQAAQCVAQSGAATTALVELYTSEGCSSCPPADRWLSALPQRYPAERVVPLALHVDYRDYIGWNDPYAKRELSLRQRKLSPLQRMALVYTPQVVLQGRDFRHWGSKAFDEALARIHATPSKARLTLRLLDADQVSLDVEAGAELLQRAEDPVLYIAAYQNRLESRVVLEWRGPFPVRGQLAERHRLPLLPGASAQDSGAAAFVQERRTGEVLQALLRSAC